MRQARAAIFAGTYKQFEDEWMASEAVRDF
jgi:hypothetical protein